MKNTTIQKADIQLLTFGGCIIDVEGSHVDNTFREERMLALKNTFEKAFEPKSNLKIRAEIGMLSFNRKCLEDAKVKHKSIELPNRTINLKADPLSAKLLQIVRLNEDSVCYFISNGLDENIFKKLAP